ncbi:hypothetical protein C2S51_030808 [Perilla frutescens var. frutescens]|nr:hypothetical protein C2S51_030808 [Perilla frutescens var. frutescens]
MSTGGGGGHPLVHSLTFRVTRLYTSPLKFDPCDLLFDDLIAASHLLRLLISQLNASSGKLLIHSASIWPPPRNSLATPTPSIHAANISGLTSAQNTSKNGSSNNTRRPVLIV